MITVMVSPADAGATVAAASVVAAAGASVDAKVAVAALPQADKTNARQKTIDTTNINFEAFILFSPLRIICEMY
jgi:hypothetical protein